jgi:hypothetical protein
VLFHSVYLPAQLMISMMMMRKAVMMSPPIQFCMMYFTIPPLRRAVCRRLRCSFRLGEWFRLL